MSALADGSLPDDVRDRALAHVTSCPDCRADLEAEQRLRARLQALPAPQPSASLIAALMAMGETGGPVPPRAGHVPGMPRPRPATIRRDPVPAAAQTDATWRTPFATAAPSATTVPPSTTVPASTSVPSLPWHRVTPGRRSTSRSTALPARPGPTSRPGGRASGRRRSVVGATASAVGVGVIAAALASGLPATQRVGPVEQLRAGSQASEAPAAAVGQDVDFGTSSTVSAGSVTRSASGVGEPPVLGVTTTVLRHVLGARAFAASGFAASSTEASTTASSTGAAPSVTVGSSAAGSGSAAWSTRSWLGASTLTGQATPVGSSLGSGLHSGGYLVPGTGTASRSR